MKRLPLVVAALLCSGCINLQVRDANFHGPTPQLGLSDSQKVPLKVAVVIPDPMGVRYYYTPPSMAAGGSKRMDQTDSMHGSKSWATELARLSSEAFPSAFQYAAVVRQLPAPGEYDAVVELELTSVDQQAFMKGVGFGGVDNDMWVAWKMSVLDGKNVETYSTQGVTPKQHFNVKAGFTAEGMIRGIEDNGGILVSQVVHDAALAARDRLAKTKKS